MIGQKPSTYIFFMTIQNKTKRFFTVFSLGDNFTEGLKLVFFVFCIKIFKVLGVRIKLNFKFTLKKFKQTFTCSLSDYSDWVMFREIFLEDEYDIAPQMSPKVIFDLGSNIGLSVIYFKLKFPEAKIYAFEPAPDVFLALEENVKQFDDVTTLNLAVSNIDGEIIFFVDPNSKMSSSLNRRSKKQIEITVPTTTLDSIMNTFAVEEVDLLKFDIEGAEYLALSGFKHKEKVLSYIGEVHFDLMDVTKEDFLPIFEGFNLDMRDIRQGQRYILRATK